MRPGRDERRGIARRPVSGSILQIILPLPLLDDRAPIGRSCGVFGLEKS